MRWAVDEALAGGVDMEITVEVAHRTSILPLVLAGIGHAVLPSAWVPLARQAGLRTVRLEPETSLHISALSRAAELTPAARAFLAAAAGLTHDVEELRAAREGEESCLNGGAPSALTGRTFRGDPNTVPNTES